MRKLLLGTTAVVGAALLSTGASAQTAPTVRIGGFFDFAYDFIRDTADRGTQPNNAARPRSSDFRSDMEVHVLVSGKTASGIGYGARLEFQNDNFTQSVATGVDMDETWLFVTSPTLGTLRMGDTDAAAAVMQVRPPRYPAFYRQGWQQARQAGLAYVYSGVTDGSDITKITYLSPQFAGFDFGVSYAINAGEGPRQFSGGSAIDRDRQNRQNEITAAVRYRGNFAGVGVALGFVTTQAESGLNQRNVGGPLTPNGRNRISAYSAGATLGYQGFTFGGEFTWGNYRGGSVGVAPTAIGADQSWHYVLGASYTFAPITVTANFGQAYQDNNVPGAVISRTGRNTLVGVGASYTIAPGLLGYINYENQQFRGWPGARVGSVFPGGSRTIQGFTIGTTLSF